MTQWLCVLVGKHHEIPPHFSETPSWEWTQSWEKYETYKREENPSTWEKCAQRAARIAQSYNLLTEE